MYYPSELLDKFDIAAGNVSAAAIHMKKMSGKAGEKAAKHDFDKARLEYGVVEKELDEFDANRT